MKLWNLCYYLNVNKIIIKQFFINKELQFVIDCKVNIAINCSIKKYILRKDIYIYKPFLLKWFNESFVSDLIIKKFFAIGLIHTYNR